jgi:L-asparaginase
MRRNSNGAAELACNAEDLIATVPELKGLATLQVKEIINIPSDDITPEHWLLLYETVSQAIALDSIDGVVITHGTDSLEETAYFSDQTIDSHKPLVILGAQRTASDTDSDGPRNLLNAFRVATSDQALPQGVLVVINEQIHSARHISKTHTTNVNGFSSGEAGMVGCVDSAGVRFFSTPRRDPRRALINPHNRRLPRVDIVAMYAGADGVALNALVQQGAKGIVVQGLGCGNVSGCVFEAIKVAIAAGVVIVISTRVEHGRVLPLYGFDGGGASLKAAGVISAEYHSPQKARIVLMLGLHQGLSQQDIQGLLCG